MANQFIHQVTKSVGTTLTRIGNYNLPAATQGVLIGVSVSNTLGSGDIKVNVYLYDSASGQNYSLITNAIVYNGATIVPVGADQKVVLQPGDSIQVQSNVASSCDAVMSLLTIS